MEATIYNQMGKESGNIKLPAELFGVKWNEPLVHQVVVSMMGNARTPIAHTKTRGEVSGTGKKPWKQKGTGRARHGSTRSPIWVGGGVAHGPRNEKNFERKVSKNMRVKALYTLLSRKNREGEILFIDSLLIKEPKTREALQILNAFRDHKGLSKKRNAAAIALGAKNKEAERAFSNFSNVEVLEARNLNPLTLLQYKYLIMENPDTAIKVLPKMKHAKS